MSELRQVKKKAIVVQSNSLVNASYSLTLSEKRIILFMISQIHKNDEDFKFYRMNIKDFINELGLDSKNSYERIEKHLTSLMSRVLQINTGDEVLLTHFLSAAKYHKGQGYIELRFDPTLKPFLLQLKECFTAYNLENILPLRSVYSIRIYELLKQYEAVGERTVRLDDFKYSLGLQDKYQGEYNALKRRVLLQAQKDLCEHTDLSFDFKEIKEGRKIAWLKFEIFKINKKGENHEKALMNDPQFVAFQELVDLGVDRQQARQFMQVKDLKEIRESIDYAKKQYSVKKVHTSLGGYLKTVIENGVQKETPFEKRQKEEQKHAQKLAEAEKQQINLLQTEFDNYRRHRLDELVNGMIEQEKEDFYQALPSFQRAIVYDDKGRIKPRMANLILRGQLAKEHKLEDDDQTFQEWVFDTQKIVLKKAFREGQDTWSIESQQASLF